jgi:hypothetical protein
MTRMTGKRPTKEQMDERVTVPLKPDEFIEGVLRAGPHPPEGDEKPNKAERKPKK